MLRAVLETKERNLSATPMVERGEIRQNLVDGWLLRLYGRVAVTCSRLSVWRLSRFATRVIAQEQRFASLSDADLRQRAADCAVALRQQGLLEAVIVDAFATVREACFRVLGKRHYPVQLMGGLVMLEGHFAEMCTGEGKTLTALLPAATMALAGVPVHVITVNEYLAARDSQLLRPVYAYLGLSVGQVLPDQTPSERTQAYRCDVAYCVNKDLTFDYLRDRMEALAGRCGARAHAHALAASKTPAAGLLRGLWFALIDEADSVFIDEARTPLIISRSGDERVAAEVCDAALCLARELRKGQHFVCHPRDRQVELLNEGIEAIAACTHPGLPLPRIDRHRLLIQALSALHCYLPDRDYLIAAGEVHIVDEFTGRAMPDRAWENGLHQMVERKEGLQVTAPRNPVARITYQRVFRRYLRVSGMSGTLAEAAGELSAVLGTRVVRIPTHRQVQRRHLGVRVFADSQARDAAVVGAAMVHLQRGRAVLIGTRSVEASERLAAQCVAAGLAPLVLNARQDGDEAAIVACAGQPGQLTVATNMAGRGTDIELAPAVRDSGGLHVILTEFHESSRIDRQLSGRAGRQGDPGSWQALVSLDDDLFSVHAPSLARWTRAQFPQAVPAWMASLLRRWAQGRAERHHAEVRRNTLAQERKSDQLLAFAGQPE